MTEIHFYHLTATPLERALPRLLEKILSAGYKTLLLCNSEERVQQLNQLLWTYDPGSFLAHGSTKDGRPEDQPILLSTTAEPLNGASMLMVTEGQTLDNPERFARVLDMFNGNDDSATEAARARWKTYKDAGHTLVYQQQTATGGWQKMAA